MIADKFAVADFRNRIIIKIKRSGAVTIARVIIPECCTVTVQFSGFRHPAGAGCTTGYGRVAHGKAAAFPRHKRLGAVCNGDVTNSRVDAASREFSVCIGAAGKINGTSDIIRRAAVHIDKAAPTVIANRKAVGIFLCRVLPFDIFEIDIAESDFRFGSVVPDAVIAVFDFTFGKCDFRFGSVDRKTGAALFDPAAGNGKLRLIICFQSIFGYIVNINILESANCSGTESDGILIGIVHLDGVAFGTFNGQFRIVYINDI